MDNLGFETTVECPALLLHCRWTSSGQAVTVQSHFPSPRVSHSDRLQQHQIQEKLSAMDRTAQFDTLFCHLSCGDISGTIADRMKSGARLSFIKISVNFKGCLNKPLACSFSLSNNGWVQYVSLKNTLFLVYIFGRGRKKI